jgi:gag-polypeptide of LTR copia-type
MADKTILTTLPKLNGSDWFEWKKEAETFLLLAGLDRVIDTEEVPTGAKAATDWTTKDHKMYVYLFFLIKPNYRAPIVKIKSGQEAWKKLVAEYEKDSAMTCMALCQQFYSLMHDPAVSITVFIDAFLNCSTTWHHWSQTG